MAIVVGVNKDNLDCYVLTDQPMSCGTCGSRTEFDEISDIAQLHECLNPACGYQFITEDVEAGNR